MGSAASLQSQRLLPGFAVMPGFYWYWCDEWHDEWWIWSDQSGQWQPCCECCGRPGNTLWLGTFCSVECEEIYVAGLELADDENDHDEVRSDGTDPEMPALVSNSDSETDPEMPALIGSNDTDSDSETDPEMPALVSDSDSETDPEMPPTNSETVPALVSDSETVPALVSDSDSETDPEMPPLIISDSEEGSEDELSIMDTSTDVGGDSIEEPSHYHSDTSEEGCGGHKASRHCMDLK